MEVLIVRDRTRLQAWHLPYPWYVESDHNPANFIKLKICGLLQNWQRCYKDWMMNGLTLFSCIEFGSTMDHIRFCHEFWLLFPESAWLSLLRSFMQQVKAIIYWRTNKLFHGIITPVPTKIMNLGLARNNSILQFVCHVTSFIVFTCSNHHFLNTFFLIRKIEFSKLLYQNLVNHWSKTATMEASFQTNSYLVLIYNHKFYSLSC